MSNRVPRILAASAHADGHSSARRCNVSGHSTLPPLDPSSVFAIGVFSRQKKPSSLQDEGFTNEAPAVPPALGFCQPRPLLAESLTHWQAQNMTDALSDARDQDNGDRLRRPLHAGTLVPVSGRSSQAHSARTLGSGFHHSPTRCPTAPVPTLPVHGFFLICLLLSYPYLLVLSSGLLFVVRASQISDTYHASPERGRTACGMRCGPTALHPTCWSLLQPPGWPRSCGT